MKSQLERFKKKAGIHVSETKAPESKPVEKDEIDDEPAEEEETDSPEHEARETDAEEWVEHNYGKKKK